MIFGGNVTGGAWTIESGGAGDTAAVKFRGNATLTSLNIDKETAEATVTFDGSSAQTIAGAITVTTNGDGVLSIGNTHNSGVTFSGAIGTNGSQDRELDC